MNTTDATSYDASAILKGMNEAQKERLRELLALNKLACSLLGRRYNKRLCAFVERKLKED